MPEEAAPPRRRRRALRGFKGAAPWLVAVVGLIAVLSLVAIGATRDRSGVRAFATIIAGPAVCSLDPAKRLNAVRCVKVARGVYRVTFSRVVSHASPVVSRETCCPGLAAISVQSAYNVIVVFPGPQVYPIRAAVLVP